MFQIFWWYLTLEVGRVGDQQRVAHVEERRVERRELHGPGDQALGDPGADLVAQRPEGLSPDLAVGVHLGGTEDLGVVGVGVAALVAVEATRAPGPGRGRRAVDALGPDQPAASTVATVVLEQVEVGLALAVDLETVADQAVGGVPVAPGLTHRAALDRAERGVARDVDHQSVGQAVGVLVVDRPGLVAGVGGRERVPVRVGGAGLVLQVHLHRRWGAVGRGVHVGVVDVIGVGQAVGGVGAVHGLRVDRVVALALLGRVGGLEVAGRLGEADRGRLQVVVEAG